MSSHHHHPHSSACYTDCKRVRELTDAISRIESDRASFWTRDALRRAIRRYKERCEVARLNERKVDATRRNLDEIKRRIEHMIRDLNDAPVVVTSTPTSTTN